MKEALLPHITDLKKEILQVLDEKKTTGYAHAQELIDRIKPLSVGGKLIRGSLILILSNQLGAKKNAAMNAAIAIELAHTGILIQDDIMDQDEMRRGIPTIHKQYALGSVDNIYGEGIAICAADILYFWAYELLAGSPELTKLFTQRFVGVAFGQIQDLEFAHIPATATVEQIEHMHLLKTSLYTFVLPFQSAALLANRDDLIEPFHTLGVHLGHIFQIRDDALAYESTSENAGKDVKSDIRENKQTIQRAILCEQDPLMRKMYGKEISDDELYQLRAAYHSSTESLVHEIILDHEKKARSIIDTLKVPNDTKNFFYDLLQYNLDRNR